jgi:hypothetical protein
MEYENGILRVENAQGRRWQLNNAVKPRLNFEYDALFVSQERALRRLGANVQPLTENEVEEVAAFIGKQEPPPSATLQRQLTADLKLFAYGLINALVTQLEYDNLLDVQIAGREGSTDLYAEEARGLLAYVDSVWNAFDGLSAQIKATPEADLKPLRDYANMMPMAPPPEHFLNGARQERRAAPAPIKETPVATTAAPAAGDEGEAASPVRVECATPETTDLTEMVDRALILDDFFPQTQLKILEQWALKTPHWMLTNSTYNEKGEAMHRIWGASYIEAFERHGWTGLPPVLYAAVAALLRKLDVAITAPEYVGLNGQSHGQDASMHADCELDSPDDLSILVYLGEDTDGDLVLYDKSDRTRQLHRIAFRPNRVVVFDGSIPHQAFAPTDGKFRMSLIIRGKYAPGCNIDAGPSPNGAAHGSGGS